VSQFFAVRLLKRDDFAMLRIDPGEDPPHRAILAGSIDTLQDKKQRPFFFNR
jgi:hypothetical protein